jgi:CelD/BcsL family acetyltransferase involved in cellulose biosynthesis
LQLEPNRERFCQNGTAFNPQRTGCDLLKVLDEPVLSTRPLPRTAVAAPLSLPPQNYLTLLTTMKSLHRLEPEWRELEQSCQTAPTVFQSFDWVKSWCEIYAKPDSARELQLVAGFQHDKLVFLWPLMLQQRGPLKILSWLTEPVGQYGDALCDAGQNANLWFSLATSYLRGLDSFDILHLRHVRQTSNFAPHAKACWHDGHLNERAAAMDLTQFKTEADYEARYDGRQRKRRKRARKSLEELGPVTYERVTDLAEIDNALELATKEKLSWLKERGRFNTTMACPGHLQLLKLLSRLDDGPVALTMTRIKVGDQAISWEICFAYRGIQYCYMTAHVNAMTDLSPGRLHFDLAQRYWLAQGQASYDLMMPYDAYKESWSSGLEPVNDYFLPLSLAGKIYGHLYLGWLRPRARKIYMRLPMPVLRVLKKLLRQ